MTVPLLRVNNLRTYFDGSGGLVRAVDGVDFEVDRGKVLGIVGESGCGKSVTALSVMRLIPHPPGRIVSGEVLLKGEDLLKKTEAEMRSVRGKQIAMIFQEPMTSLNPVLTIGEQIGEMLRLHLKLSRRAALDRAGELLDWVGIPSPRERVKDYPHQLSGGMRQRVMIAMSISCQPDLIFADEPTTALDVTIQAQILNLLERLREQLGMALVLITHDLGVVAEVADEVTVMYAGKVVERAPTPSLFDDPRHPYTRGLLASLPAFAKAGERLHAIPGSVPRPDELPKGCRFSTRCPVVIDRCPDEEPPLVEVAPRHWAACWLETGDGR
jgi:oligopeptide/dipeptide ABC transporter ATP-binding protein